MKDLFERPSDLLLWFLDAEGHEAATDYGWYANYRGEGFKRYTRRHYDDRLAGLTESPGAGRTLLEVGSGHGIELLWLASRGWNAVGVEPMANLHAASLARKFALERHLGRALSCEFRHQSLFRIPETHAFDVVYLREAFHHLEPRAAAVPTLAALPKPGGRIVIAEDNAWNPALQLLLFKRRGFSRIVEAAGPDGETVLLGNERILTPGSLTRLFRPFGITACHRYFRLLPSALAESAVLRAVAARLEPALAGAPPAAPLHVHYEWIGTRKAVS